MPEILAAASRGPARSDPSTSFAHLDRTWGRVEKEPRWIVTATEYPYRLIYYPDGDTPNELYDLARDPGEQDNLYMVETEVSDRLEERASEYVTQPLADWAKESKTVELDDLMIGQLRAIGYAIE